MTFRMHPSVRPIQVPDFNWLSNGLRCNPFLEYDLAQKAAIKLEEESDDQQANIDPIGQIIIKPQKYQLLLDMIHFKPEDISIQATHNGFFVRAAHPDIVDGHEYVTQHFYREYVLPHDICPEETRAWITPEYILYIEAPKAKFDQVPNENSPVINVELEKL